MQKETPGGRVLNGNITTGISEGYSIRIPKEIHGISDFQMSNWNIPRRATEVVSGWISGNITRIILGTIPGEFYKERGI